MTYAPVPLPSAPPGWFDYRFYLLSDGTLGVLRTDRDINGEYRTWWEREQKARFPRKMPDFWNGSSKLHRLSDNGESATIDVPLVRHPEIDRFADGRWLVVSTRAAAGENNALILDADGRVSCSFHIGDGIEHVRCAPDGSIWVGYFDEGIFGSSVGAGGIVRFDDQGKRLWSYNDEGRNSSSFIDDCYALTLNGNELWSCYYSDFPIILIRNGKETQWGNGVEGAKALAVDGTNVLLAGGYGYDTRLALVELDEDKAQLVGSYDRPELSNAALLQGRSSMLHVVNDRVWTRISVAEARSKLVTRR